MTRRGDPKSSSARRSGDDFRKIDGVGRVFEQRLSDAGIVTYKDLARRTPAEIASVLAPVKGTSREYIASQARELAGPIPEAFVPSQHIAAFHVEFLLESDNRVHHTNVLNHQTGDHATWAEWNEEKLLTFLRAHIPLPVAGTPADAPGPVPAHTRIPDYEPASIQAAPTSRPSPSGPDRPPSWSLSIEEFAQVGDDRRSYAQGPEEPNFVRLRMRITPASKLRHDTFDYSAELAARIFGGSDRSFLGSIQGTIRVGDPVFVTVTGPALPTGLYRLLATVEIYSAGHTRGEPPIHSQGVAGDLMLVAGSPLGSAPEKHSHAIPSGYSVSA